MCDPTPAERVPPPPNAPFPPLPVPQMKNTANWSAECQDFIARMLKKNPKDRPEASELLQDPFLAKVCCR